MNTVIRRTVLAAAGLCLAAPVAAAPAGANAAPAPAAALPAVNMSLALVAAQIDPVRTDHTYTRGAEASVKLIEQALQARGLLDAQYVDGYYGTSTITAYTKFQNSLGYTSAVDANGIPGTASLAKLGAGRFTITEPVKVGAHTTWKGYEYNERTVAMLTEAQKVSGVTVTPSKSSYRPWDNASKCTHCGGGVGDLSVSNLSQAQIDKLVLAMRQVGFAAYHRTRADGYAPHIHFAAINDTTLHPEARNQVGKYYLGLNGLRNDGKDNGPHVKIQPWESYQKTH